MAKQRAFCTAGACGFLGIASPSAWAQQLPQPPPALLCCSPCPPCPPLTPHQPRPILPGVSVGRAAGTEPPHVLGAELAH